MCVSVVGRSRRSEHTLQFYCVALDLPFKTYLFSKSDINHMCLLDKYLNSCIYSSSTVCMLIKSSNRKTTMHFFFIWKLILLRFACWTFCTWIFIIILHLVIFKTLLHTYPVVFICLFMWHMAQIFFRTCFMLVPLVVFLTSRAFHHKESGLSPFSSAAGAWGSQCQHRHLQEEGFDLPGHCWDPPLILGWSSEWASAPRCSSCTPDLP